MLRNWVGGMGAAYHDAVWRAVLDTGAQATFRREQAYHNIVNVADYHGRAYHAQIVVDTISEILMASEQADRIGAPVTYDYSGKQLAPNTLRYAKVLQDLISLFPSFPQMKAIAEIGVGYGGQARLLSEYARLTTSQLSTYDLIDILPVCFLAQGYLDNFRMYPACRFMTKSQIPRAGSWDLAISNYAFSEFDADLQQEYLENVLLRSSSGYLTMNSGLSDAGQWQHLDQNCISVEVLLKLLPNAVLVPENPVLYFSNYIIVWGQHNAGAGVPLHEMRETEKKLRAEHERWQEEQDRQRIAAESNESKVQADGPGTLATEAAVESQKRSFLGWINKNFRL